MRCCLSMFVPCLLLIVADVSGQTAYFADGYHGGIYGHYPMWQAEFMLEKLHEFPDWKINLEIEPETWDVVKERDAENYARLQAYFDQVGRFGRIEFVNPTYAQPYCYNISGESLIRQFTYGMDKIREHFPAATFDTYACEEPCFTSCLPQLLTSLGYRYAVARCPDTCWGGYTSAFGKDLVRWKSSDGSSILTVPRYACEGFVENSTWQTTSWNNSPRFIRTCLDSGIRFPVGMCFQDAGWRNGPWLGNGQRSFPPKTEYVTWTGYIEDIAPKVTPEDWDFSQEDVKPGLVWGAQVLQRIGQQVRHTENRLVMAEKAAVLDAVVNRVSYPREALDEAWRTLMLAQHHDCWIVPYNGRRGHTWADNVTRWTKQSNQTANRLIQRLLDPASGDSEGERGYVRVLNTTGTHRDDLARVSLPRDAANETWQVLDAEGNAVKSQAIASKDGRRDLIFAASVPPLGYSTYQLTPGPTSSSKIHVATQDDRSLQVETNYYVATIDTTQGGTITSLIAKQLGNIQLVAPDQGLNALQGHFYEDQQFVSTADRPAKVTVIENGDLLVRIRVESSLSDQPCIQLVTFYENEPRLDFELTIDWQGTPGIGAYSQQTNYRKEDRRKAFYDDRYKLHVRFPLQEIGQRVFKNAPFDVCESRLNDTYYDRWDQIKHNVILSWVDCADATEKIGVALFSDHTTSYLHDPQLPLGLTVQYTGRALWGRNYTLDGPTHVRYAILPHADRWDQFGVQRHCTAWNEPLLAANTESPGERHAFGLLEVEPAGIEVVSTAFEEDTLFVRLFNAESATDRVVVSWCIAAEDAKLVRINGDIEQTLSVTERTDDRQQVELQIPRFGIRTLKLTGVSVAEDTRH